jgi:hypothetical protein
MRYDPPISHHSFGSLSLVIVVTRRAKMVLHPIRADVMPSSASEDPTFKAKLGGNYEKQ